MIAKTKLLREKKIVSRMISIYCRGNKHSVENDSLCSDCRELLDYAIIRSDRCPFMENKTFCGNCKVHCYKPNMKEKIRKVMKYSGPRMLFYHPLMTINHMIHSVYERKRRR